MLSYINKLRRSKLRLFLENSFKGLYLERFGESIDQLKGLKDSKKGETCFVIGNGPGLNDLNLDLLKNHDTFGTNGIFLKFVPTYYCTVSVEFYKNHIRGIRDLKCSKKFIGFDLKEVYDENDESSILLNRVWNIYGSFRGIYFPVPFRFSRDSSKVVFYGGTVLFICLQIAFYMGYKKVVLIGVDHNFGLDNTKAKYGGEKLRVKERDEVHFSQTYSPKGHQMTVDILATERAFKLAKNAFESDGRSIVNASSKSKLEIFDRVDYNSLF